MPVFFLGGGSLYLYQNVLLRKSNYGKSDFYFLFFSKEFACNGTVVDHPEYGEVIQLQGDQRVNIRDFLRKIGIAKDEQLKVRSSFFPLSIPLYLSLSLMFMKLTAILLTCLFRYTVSEYLANQAPFCYYVLEPSKQVAMYLLAVDVFLSITICVWISPSLKSGLYVHTMTSINYPITGRAVLICFSALLLFCMPLIKDF